MIDDTESYVERLKRYVEEGLTGKITCQKCNKLFNNPGMSQIIKDFDGKTDIHIRLCSFCMKEYLMEREKEYEEYKRYRKIEEDREVPDNSEYDDIYDRIFDDFRKSEFGEFYRNKSLERIRRRYIELDTFNLNDKFYNSEGHHVDKQHIVNIPEELHHSIYHNIWTGKGMKEINRKVMEWYDENVDSLGLNSSFKMES